MKYLDRVAPRLERYDLELLNGSDRFLKRLCREQNWTNSFARRVIQEYKRFVLLAASSETQVSPSEAIDQVWHLHLLYTQEYWGNFCKNVLEKDLHHFPALGGEGEKTRLDESYAETIARYQEVFGALPPQDIWPPVHRRLRLPKASLRARMLERIGLATSAFLLVLAPQNVSALTPLEVLNLRGPDFLRVYAIVVALGVVVALAVPLIIYLMSSAKAARRDFSAEEVAFVRGGRHASVLVALAKLLHHGAITSNAQGKIVPTAATDKLDETELMRSVRLSSLTTSKVSSQPNVRAVCARIEEALIRDRLLLSTQEHFWSAIFPVLVSASVIGFGLIKLSIGLERGKPVGLLCVIMVILGVATIAFALNVPRRTRAGTALLRRLREKHERLNLAPRSEERPLAVALFGVSALYGTELAAHVRRYFPTSGNGSSGCGGSGCSGGGCGGGGCGGGCGGCS